MRNNPVPARPSPSAGHHDRPVPELSPVEARLARIIEGRDFPALSQHIGETISALDDSATSIQHLTNVVLREYSLTLCVVRTANRLGGAMT